MLRLEPLRIGGRCTVFALAQENGCKAVDWLMELPEEVRLKLYRAIAMLAEQGLIRNQQRFRRLEDGVYELKLRNPPVRLFCFQHGPDWVCTHGDRKPGQRELRVHIAKVKTLRKRLVEESS